MLVDTKAELAVRASFQAELKSIYLHYKSEINTNQFKCEQADIKEEERRKAIS